MSQIPVPAVAAGKRRGGKAVHPIPLFAQCGHDGFQRGVLQRVMDVAVLIFLRRIFEQGAVRTRLAVEPVAGNKTLAQSFAARIKHQIRNAARPQLPQQVKHRLPPRLEVIRRRRSGRNAVHGQNAEAAQRVVGLRPLDSRRISDRLHRQARKLRGTQQWNHVRQQELFQAGIIAEPLPQHPELSAELLAEYAGRGQPEVESQQQRQVPVNFQRPCGHVDIFLERRVDRAVRRQRSVLRHQHHADVVRIDARLRLAQVVVVAERQILDVFGLRVRRVDTFGDFEDAARLAVEAVPWA